MTREARWSAPPSESQGPPKPSILPVQGVQANCTFLSSHQSGEGKDKKLLDIGTYPVVESCWSPLARRHSGALPFPLYHPPLDRTPWRLPSITQRSPRVTTSLFSRPRPRSRRRRGSGAPRSRRWTASPRQRPSRRRQFNFRRTDSNPVTSSTGRPEHLVSQPRAPRLLSSGRTSTATS